jgi:phage terminase large subunit
MSALAEPSRLWTPPNLFEEMERRRKRLERCNADRDLQQLALEACAADRVLWLQDWVWTYDPRQPDAVMPFIPFPRQVEYLAWREERKAARERGVVEKSRDMGVTWLNVADQVHDWRFHDGHKGGFGSRKADLVDHGDDPDSIFAKVRFIVLWLPAWMRPAGFDTRRHATHMRLVNPANGNTLVGESGDDIGRGGRSRVYDLDEAAHVERPLAVEAALSQNTDILFETSTPKGAGNPFAKRARGGVVKVFSFHWRQDPRKGEAWYAKQVAELDPIVVAQEIDIDYDASVSGLVIPMSMIRPSVGRAPYPDERGAICVGVDVAEEGRDKSSHVVREGRNVSDIAEWHGADPVESTKKLVALGLVLEKRLGAGHRLYFFVDKIGVGSGVVAGLREYVNERQALHPRWVPWAIVAVSASEAAPPTSPVCHRLKDWLWWSAREWFRVQAPSLPSGRVGEQLARELAGPTYGLSNAGAVQVESKKDMAKRGIPSPNLADALVHTFKWHAMKPATETERERFERMRDEAGGGTWMSQ